MKDKILRTQLVKACEDIAKALRSYTGENQPLYCDITIATRKYADMHDKIDIFVSAPGCRDYVVDYSEKVIYTFDNRHGELILKTERLNGGD